MRLRGTHRLLCSCFNQQLWGRLDLAVLFTPSTPNRQNRNQVRWNICAGVRQSTPSFEVVQTEQSRDLFQKRWRIIACMLGIILFRLIYSGVLQSAQFYLFMWLFWRTPSTLKIAKSNPPLVNMHRCTDSQEHSLLADATRSQKYVLVDLGQTWFSCSLYSFHSEQAEQKTSALEHLCWRTPEYSVFRGGVDRTVTWPVPKQDGGTLFACVEIFVSLDLFWSTPKFPVLLVLGGWSCVRRVLLNC